MTSYYFEHKGSHFHDLDGQDFETWPIWEVKEIGSNKLVGTLWLDGKQNYRFAYKEKSHSSFSRKAKTFEEVERLITDYLNKHF